MTRSDRVTVCMLVMTSLLVPHANSVAMLSALFALLVLVMIGFVFGNKEQP